MVVSLSEVPSEVVEATLAFVYKGEISQGQAAALEEARRVLGLVGADFEKEKGKNDEIEAEKEVAVEEEAPAETEGRTKSRRKRTRNKKWDYQEYETDSKQKRSKEADEAAAEEEADEAAVVPKKEPFFYVEEDYACCGTDFISRAELDSHKKSYGCEEDEAKKQKEKEKQKQEEKDAEAEKKPQEKKKRRAPGAGAGRAKKVNKENLKCCDTEFENELEHTSHKAVDHQEKPAGKFIICCDEKITGDLKVHLKDNHSLDDATDQSQCCDNTFEGLLDLTRHCATTHGLRLSQYKRMIWEGRKQGLMRGASYLVK